MSQAEQIREYYKENPTASYDDASQALGIVKNSVKANISRDIKAGKCIRNEDGSIDYYAYFKTSEEILNFRDWQNDVRRELIDQLLEANRHETASDQIRLNAKEINKLLSEVTK
ncbi:hypothetical protein BKX95_08465 [Streptococcus iniae]|nr:hypothetical protein BKX95_08465 [Streptococcus iniae]